MNRFLIAIALLALALGARGEYDPGYYTAMNGKSKSALKAAAKACVKDHRRLVYIDLHNYWQYSDVYPELVNGSKRWWKCIPTKCT